MKPFCKGDAVKLTDRFARTLMASTRHGRYGVDWLKRRGVVFHVNTHNVLVLWQSTKSPDNLPVGAVEKIMEGNV
jgi:hypothetical protein